MNLYDLQGKPVRLGESIGRGGEATVYRLAGDGSTRLAKIYEPEPRPNYLLKLAWMVEHPPVNPTEKYSHASLAWPDGLIYDRRHRLKGYTMPHIKRAVPLLEVFNPRRRAEVLPQFDRRYLYRTARNLAAALGALHRSGYVAGDINESNVLVTPKALVTIIDTDSFQVTETREGNHIIYPCPVGKPEYTPPELQGKSLDQVTRQSYHDNFGLAVLIFQLLMEGSHPFRAQWLAPGEPPPLEARIARGLFPYAASNAAPIAPPRHAPDIHNLHPGLVELFRRCFMDGQRNPRSRPSPDRWIRAIIEAEHALIHCSQGHYFSNHLAQCPYCGGSQRRPDQPAVRPDAERPRAGWASPPWQTHQPQPAAAWPRGPQAAPQRAPAQAAGAQTVQAGRAVPQTGSPRFPSPFGGWPRVIATAGAQGGAPGSASVFGGPLRASGGVLRSRSVIAPGALRNYTRQRVQKSVLVGGGQGALAGAIPGALIALINWSAGELLAWGMLLALGGALGGLLRGWNPGHKLSLLVGRYIGWKRFWEGAGLVGGAIGGTMLGLVFVWAVVPVILGLVLGAQTGRYIGGKIYQVGSLFGWERIGGAMSAASSAAIGWGLAVGIGALGLNSLGIQLADALLPFSANGSLWWALVWAMAGGAGGALAGGISGFLADLFGRLTGLVN